MRKVVIESIAVSSDGTMGGRVYFRYPVPAARQSLYANPTLTPEAPGDYAGAHADELTALRNGEWYERLSPNQRSFPTSTPVATLQEAIVQDYEIAEAAFQAADNARLAYYGSSWDGTVDANGVPVWSMTSL